MYNIKINKFLIILSDIPGKNKEKKNIKILLLRMFLV